MYRTKCKFLHPKQICNDHISCGKCENKSCPKRHPKRCKWVETQYGCKQKDCEYLHDGVASGEAQVSCYECVSCKDVWENNSCVKEQTVQNHKVYFCLNCDEWVKDKERVLDKGWVLLDNNGYLNQGI